MTENFADGLQRLLAPFGYFRPNAVAGDNQNLLRHEIRCNLILNTSKKVKVSYV
jgi:hypothetical protein